jgi:hypothetical protein
MNYSEVSLSGECSSATNGIGRSELGEHTSQEDRFRRVSSSDSSKLLPEIEYHNPTVNLIHAECSRNV